MDRKDDREILRKGGFAEIEVNRLHQLRTDHHEKERLRTVAELRRMEFVRWLILRGKLTDQIA
ncbi:MAG: hypothetical protein M3Z24_04385 [Chloroflexota bacterium]|nr:hypothetical protein [Chloroflexota bacterium]